MRLRRLQFLASREPVIIEYLAGSLNIVHNQLPVDLYLEALGRDAVIAAPVTGSVGAVVLSGALEVGVLFPQKVLLEGPSRPLGLVVVPSVAMVVALVVALMAVASVTLGPSLRALAPVWWVLWCVL